MPRRDGTGPSGKGAMTGRGLGFCTAANVIKCATGVGIGLGLRFGSRRGFGRRLGRYFTTDQTVSKTHKESLQEQKELLESRLNVIEKQIERL